MFWVASLIPHRATAVNKLVVIHSENDLTDYAHVLLHAGSVKTVLHGEECLSRLSGLFLGVVVGLAVEDVVGEDVVQVVKEVSSVVERSLLCTIFVSSVYEREKLNLLVHEVDVSTILFDRQTDEVHHDTEAVKQEQEHSVAWLAWVHIVNKAIYLFCSRLMVGSQAGQDSAEFFGIYLFLLALLAGHFAYQIFWLFLAELLLERGRLSLLGVKHFLVLVSLDQVYNCLSVRIHGFMAALKEHQNCFLHWR